VFWAVPIGLMGQAWKLGLWRLFRPLFDCVDQSARLHAFAVKYIYSKELYADFFVLSFMLGCSSLAALATVVYYQVTTDWLPWWVVYAYYFSWVGMGGRGMGGAYTLAHKEGHHRGGGLYRPWIANTVGNFWENWMGLIYGVVPYNFSTAHVFLHHKLNAGKGDTMYQWDLDRSSWSDLMLYQYRVLTYMTGSTSLTIFKDLGKAGNKTASKNYDLLRFGCAIYWLVFPSVCMFLLVGVAKCSVLSSGTLGLLCRIHVHAIWDRAEAPEPPRAVRTQKTPDSLYRGLICMVFFFPGVFCIGGILRPKNVWDRSFVVIKRRETCVQILYQRPMCVCVYVCVRLCVCGYQCCIFILYI